MKERRTQQICGSLSASMGERMKNLYLCMIMLLCMCGSQSGEETRAFFSEGRCGFKVLCSLLDPVIGQSRKMTSTPMVHKLCNQEITQPNESNKIFNTHAVLTG